MDVDRRKFTLTSERFALGFQSIDSRLMSIAESPVGIDKAMDRLVILDDAVKEQEGFFILSSKETGHLVAALVDRAFLPQDLVPKPLAAEVFGQSDASGVGEHPSHLLLQNILLSQFSACCKVQ